MPTSLNMPYLLLAGAIVVAVVFGFSVLQPALDDVRAAQASLAERQADLLEQETFLRTLDAKLAQLEINREHENRLQVILPAEERMEDAIRIIQRAAAGSGMIVDEIANNSEGAQAEARQAQARGQATAPPEDISPLSLNLTVTGPYQGLRGFITALEKTPRLMDINSLDIRSTTEQPDILRTQISLLFYMITPNAATE